MAFEDWTRAEVVFIVNDYFTMLNLELAHKPYNKAEHRRELIPLLNNRNKAVEYKHQNISAVLVNLGLPFIKGYKPLFNYQQVLEEEVVTFIANHKISLEKGFDQFSVEIVKAKPDKINFETFLTDEPEKSTFKESEPTYRPIKINYLKREQNNRSLGEEGEKLVIAYESHRLLEAGKRNLIDKIEWTSKERGDGTGYDILSKNIDGSDRFIEVKTTKLSKETPIYLTRTEVNFASDYAKDFYLYRVFNFDTRPKAFIKNGKYESFCTLKPQTFKGYF